MPFYDPRRKRTMKEIENSVHNKKKAIKKAIAKKITVPDIVKDVIKLKYKELEDKKYYVMYLRGLEQFLKKESKNITLLNYHNLIKEIETIKKHIETLW